MICFKKVLFKIFVVVVLFFVQFGVYVVGMVLEISLLVIDEVIYSGIINVKNIDSYLLLLYIDVVDLLDDKGLKFVIIQFVVCFEFGQIQ